MTDKIEIGDYVEVDIGMGLGAIGIVVTEDQYMSAMREHTMRNIREQNNKYGWASSAQAYLGNRTSYRIKFIDGSTHTALAEECRKLTDKEIFKAKLSDDKRIYEI